MFRPCPGFIAGFCADITDCGNLCAVLPGWRTFNREAVTDINTDMSGLPDYFAWRDIREVRRYSGTLLDHLIGIDIRNAVRRALDYAEANRARFEAFAAERAKTLLADHRRVRDASDDRGSFGVKPILPVDIMGVFVLLPEED